MKRAVKESFKAAKNISKNFIKKFFIWIFKECFDFLILDDAKSDDYIERSEFRMLMVALR